MKIFFSSTVLMTIIVSVLLSCGDRGASTGLKWQNGWVRALPPGSGMTAAYGELKNESNEAIQLVAYDSNAFSSVTLHQSVTEGGVSRMREQAGVQIAAGEVLKLEPGGLHLMLMRPKGEILVGGEIEIGITSDTQRYVFRLPVEAR